MKKYDEFELDLKNEEVENEQPMARSVPTLPCIYTVTKYSVKHNCSHQACENTKRTVNTCRTV
ncbi:hypothetical protein [Paraclostridium sp. AKS81]|uniref:hypothetical protein n=1 Tax=Paraclostridium sp. AKS81 TaxID=2876117 RepID=UPI0021DFD21B|nr:hypothetical protein [Paraclostridium sp. AKS81]MCU9813238.1 hypothetical protein [Paraclostridium sp. AKS81]